MFLLLESCFYIYFWVGCVFLYFGVCAVWMCVLCASKYEIRLMTDYIKHTKVFYLSKMLYLIWSQQCIEITTQELMHITHCIIRTIDINQQVPYEYKCGFLHLYLTPRQKWQIMLDKVLWSHTFVYWDIEALHYSVFMTCTY